MEAFACERSAVATMIVTIQVVEDSTFIEKQKLIVSSANQELAFAVVFNKIHLFSSF